MTDSLDADRATAPSAGHEPLDPGHQIRAAREARGQTLLHLSILLKISERRLQAFEDGRWAEVGDTTFVRALAQSLCRHLDLDPVPVLQALPAVKPSARPVADQGRVSEPGLPPFKALREPVRFGTAGSGTPWFTPLRGAVALILAGALGLALMPPTTWLSRPAVDPAPPAPPAPVASGPAAAGSEPAIASAPGAMPAASAPASAPNATPPLAPASPAVAESASAPLQLKATKDTWVQVTDARGQVIFSRLLTSGERVGVEGTRPLRLRVGNVSGTEAVWLGRRLALDEQQRNNVADVELP